MSDNIMEQTPAQAGGAAGQPTPHASPVAGQPSPGASSLEQQLAVIAARLEAIERSGQSAKDKGIANVGKRVNSLEAKLEDYAKLRQQGMTEDGAKRELFLRDLYEQQAGSTPQGVAAPKEDEVDYTALIAALGISPNDPGITEALKQRNVTAALIALKSQRAGAAPQPTPTPAQQMPTGGGQPASGDLNQEYQKRLAALRRGDIQGVYLLKEEYRKKGLDIY